MWNCKIGSVNLVIKFGRFSKYRKSSKSGTEKKRLCIVFTSSINRRKCRIRKFTFLLSSSNKFNTTCDAHARTAHFVIKPISFPTFFCMIEDVRRPEMTLSHFDYLT